MRTIRFVLTLVLVMTFTVSFAQLTKEQIKERKEIKKASKAELGEKATKTARKAAKRLAKGDGQPRPVLCHWKNNWTSRTSCRWSMMRICFPSISWVRL